MSNVKIPIKAQIYSIGDGKYTTKAFANVAVGDYLFINSFSVALSSYQNEMTVFPPSIRCSNGSYKKILEFPKHTSSKLLETIQKVCLDAYYAYEDSGELHRWTKPRYVKIEDLLDLEKHDDNIPQKSAEVTNFHSDVYGDIPF